MVSRLASDVEWGNRSGHLTANGKRFCESLRDGLSKR